MLRENLFQKELEDPYEEAIKEFASFIREGAFTSDQMREAYHLLLGISENKEQDPAVGKILAKMNEMADNGFPLNRFAELVGFQRDFETAIPRYYQFIDSLDFSQKEAAVLKSIVERKRKGEVEFLVDGINFATLKIRATGLKPELLAEELINLIGEVIKKIPKGKKCELMFVAGSL